jgi:hypothetical protein
VRAALHQPAADGEARVGPPVRVWLREDDAELDGVEGNVSAPCKRDASHVDGSQPEALLRTWALVAEASGTAAATGAPRPVKRFKLDTSALSMAPTPGTATRRCGLLAPPHQYGVVGTGLLRDVSALCAVVPPPGLYGVVGTDLSSRSRG